LTNNPKKSKGHLKAKGGCVMAKEIKKDDKVAVSFWVDKEIADKLDYFAEKGGITKSKLLSNIVEAVLHDMTIIDKVGFVGVACFLMDLREAIKNKFTNYKDKRIMSNIMKDKDYK
jgi:hypothetical protein